MEYGKSWSRVFLGSYWLCHVLRTIEDVPHSVGVLHMNQFYSRLGYESATIEDIVYRFIKMVGCLLGE